MCNAGIIRRMCFKQFFVIVEETSDPHQIGELYLFWFGYENSHKSMKRFENKVPMNIYILLSFYANI